MKKIRVSISPEGEIKIITSGFAGSECKAATKGLEKALGVVTKDTPTAEARDLPKAMQGGKTNVDTGR